MAEEFIKQQISNIENQELPVIEEQVSKVEVEIKEKIIEELPVVENEVKEVVITNLVPLVNQKCSVNLFGWNWSLHINRQTPSKPEESKPTEEPVQNKVV